MHCNVFYDGPDAAEYKIVGDSLGFLPLINFDMDSGKVVWVDVLFKADLTKTGVAKYAPRHANLVATYVSQSGEKDSTLIQFTGLVQHAVLVLKPQFLDIGFVTKGVAEGGNIIIIDTGDAPFVLKSSSFPNPPVTSVTIDSIALSPGDTIHRGDTITLHVLVQLDTYSDTTVSYTLFSDHACGDFTGVIHVAASQLLVQATGYPAPDVFIGCREHDSTVVFLNKGSVVVTLDSVDISGANPPGQFDLVDSKGNRGTSLTIGKKLNSFQSDTIGIVYHPSVSGPASGTIRFIYDSAGTKKVITTQATGNGVQLRTTLSAAQASGQPYTANVGSSFDVPVSLATTALPPNADAWRITFTMTYRQDVVNLIGTPTVNVDSGYNYSPGKTPAAYAVGTGDEAIDFDVTRNAPITNLNEIVHATYEVMVAKEVITPFIVSKGTFYDSKNNVICYIATDTIPSAFIPGYLCGDSALHYYLKGVLPTRISMVSPNIVTENETPVLYYIVNRTNVPVKVEIYNVLGEMVRTVKNTLTQPVGSYKLPVGTRGLPSGTYMVRLTTPESSETANFIIRK